MCFLLRCFLVIFVSVPLVGQGTPPSEPAQEEQAQGSPPPPASSTMQKMKVMIRKEVNKAIEGKPYPSVSNWQPLTTREKFDVFLNHTYAPRTFVSAGIDALQGTIRNPNPEYEHGVMGIGQRYGVNLGIGETEIFFEQFLVPSVLKQDPRYFRNPTLPFAQRAMYSMSRVVITNSDKGHTTFNASRILGGAISQALADLYVPGQRQGLHPVLDRVTFGLMRDTGLNLVHEFWPDLRRKFLHR